MSAQINKLKLHPSGQRLLTVAVARPTGITVTASLSENRVTNLQLVLNKAIIVRRSTSTVR